MKQTHQVVGSKESHKARMSRLFDEDQKAGVQPSTKSTGSAKVGGVTYKKCAHSHPPLPMGKTTDGKTMVIYGGACSSVIVPDVDVSVALDFGFRLQGSKHGFVPWNNKLEFLFEIPDMGVPKDVSEFKVLINHLEKWVRAGLKVHVGCIGGHGRTGTVLSALVSQMLPEVEDAIGYVRKNYCERAVESREQVEYLHKHFGVKKVKGYKEGGQSGGSHTSYSTNYSSGGGQGKHQGQGLLRTTKHSYSGLVATALPGPECIWYRKPIAPK